MVGVYSPNLSPWLAWTSYGLVWTSYGLLITWPIATQRLHSVIQAYQMIPVFLSECPPKTRRCNSTDQCVPVSKWCDQVPDCGDCSDEPPDCGEYTPYEGQTSEEPEVKSFLTESWWKATL